MRNKGDDKPTHKQLTKDLKRISGSLRLDGKAWMANLIEEAILRLENQVASLTTAQAKIERQRVNLREQRENSEGG